MNNSRCCSIHFSCNCLSTNTRSTVLLSLLKKHWLSGRMSSEMEDIILSSIIFVSTFPSAARSDITRLFPYTALSLFPLNILTRSACLYCCGRQPDLHAASINVWMTRITMSPPYHSTSAGGPNRVLALCCFSALIWRPGLPTALVPCPYTPWGATLAVIQLSKGLSMHIYSKRIYNVLLLIVSLSCQLWESRRPHLWRDR